VTVNKNNKKARLYSKIKDSLKKINRSQKNNCGRLNFLHPFDVKEAERNKKQEKKQQRINNSKTKSNYEKDCIDNDCSADNDSSNGTGQ